MGKRRKLLTQPNHSRPDSRPKKPSFVPQKAPPTAAGPPKKKSKQVHREEAVVPFEPHHRILLVGEGDLSFAASLVEHHGCTNVTATVLERDEGELRDKYPHVGANIAVIRGEKRPREDEEDEEKDQEEQKDQDDAAEDATGTSKDDDIEADNDRYNSDDEFDDEGNPVPKHTTTNNNNKLLYNIDATKLSPSLSRAAPFDRIIFNFPHVGGKSTDVNRQVRHNQSLLVAFFQRALPALVSSSSRSPSGRMYGSSGAGAVVVTLFEGEPYTLWNVRDLARHAGLQVETSFRFQPTLYPGYRHARTLGVVRNARGEATGGGWRGEERLARSYVFKAKGDVDVPGAGSKKKKRPRGGNDESSDEDD